MRKRSKNIFAILLAVSVMSGTWSLPTVAADFSSEEILEVENQEGNSEEEIFTEDTDLEEPGDIEEIEDVSPEVSVEEEPVETCTENEPEQSETGIPAADFTDEDTAVNLSKGLSLRFMDAHRPCDLNWELFKGSYYFSNNFFDNNSFTVFVFFFAFFYILSLNFSFISVYINLLSFICKNLYTGCVSSFFADINYCTHGSIHILAICIIRGEHHFCTNIYYQGLFRKTYIFNILISHITLNNSPKFLFCFFIQSSHVCLIDFS